MALTFEQHLKLAAGLGRLLVENASDVAELASDVPRLVRLGGQVTALIDSVQGIGAPGTPLPQHPINAVPATDVAAAIEARGLTPEQRAIFDRASFSTGA